MSEVINENECPSCHSTDSKITDTTYNQESRICNQCGTNFQVNFKLIPYNVRIVHKYQP